ncbi:uncharacterized protein DNG_04793 [Cephalotrichum gorgonifer]|uniref:Dolichyl-diphosphooligosaccharide-protein glycosyltransferase subunit OST5 n=1 Tax=Cephalotrichum gorgonifer TaxID=2041049 RepID=A0AAE8MXA8_9PEZI|nr:uncharacterized protein DNG_04793 [Cephalotrichum gorgonifer]
MDSSLREIWTAAQGSPFTPAIGKDSQFYVGFGLLVLGILLAGLFTLNRSFASVATLGVPASFAVAVGVVYMFCAVGVYV